ncbi:hypothetical protein DENIS_4933 [Desulfonema ishimotonii]|uniref:Uncharacterized protein n=1 Tax=Desulfonema ishimotonii TaxID=45657 RepID=A0A401G409_9BACT|nr:hypothetical protein [Desulfonema ishimotonii]GBC63933.1 hypothetical protein DENIS_4933 [Desulfonema ishimotonii]
MAQPKRVLKIFISFPATWLVVFLTVMAEWGFEFWFQPPLFLRLSAAGLGVFFLLLWPVIFIRSDVFRRKYNHIPEIPEIRSLEALLVPCHPSFRQPATECLALVGKIRKEFRAGAFQEEVDALLRNLAELARNHTELLERSRQFGTQQQKEAMARLLKEQGQSVDSSLTALRRFSGNLTLFDTHIRDQTEIDGELKAINVGLQEAIREIQHD